MQALVTRPRDESEVLAAALALRQIVALIEPLIDVAFRDAAALDLAGVQAVLCTSANGVRALARASSERDLPLFAVGAATAERARVEGFTAVASAGGDVGDLVCLVAARLDPQQGRLLHVAGATVAGDLAGALRARGFGIDRSILYEARPVAALSAAAVHAVRLGTIDFGLFFSPRTAEIFVRLAHQAGIAESCRAMAALSISRAADAAVSELPWGDRRIAETPSRSALLAALDCLVAERRGR